MVLCHSGRLVGPEMIERFDVFGIMGWAIVNHRCVRAFTIHFHELHLDWNWSIRAHLTFCRRFGVCTARSRLCRRVARLQWRRLDPAFPTPHLG
jgi:hypothetical protein